MRNFIIFTPHHMLRPSPPAPPQREEDEACDKHRIGRKWIKRFLENVRKRKYMADTETNTSIILK
jgi:hypothetical protein